eukprot:TRINITY_DN7262_c0_g2_i1.p1 TRINITY_DN7262_c0_g2~~TRINITY_DN7262_c0_g2_i1.p1  ORF type:complete len:156 (+),score=30.56 TRINITY_DN7262_c0_g2_i1:1-468(+)
MCIRDRYQRRVHGDLQFFFPVCLSMELDEAFNMFVDADKEYVAKEIKVGDEHTVFIKSAINDFSQVKGCIAEVLWAAAPIMGNYLREQYLQEDGDKLSGFRIMEIGAGTGLLGIYLAKYSNAEEVMISDYDVKSSPLILFKKICERITQERKPGS